MENNGSKVIAIIGLIAGIVGITIGFAAFTNTLTISSSATVTPDSSTFDVDFSRSAASADTESVTAITSGGATGTAATINNAATGGPKISGLQATFTAPGQSVSYKFYARNVGQYIAYLKSITFGTKSCTSSDATITETLKTAACNKISIAVHYGGTNGSGGTNYTATASSITGKSIAIGGNAEVYVTITYSSDGNARPDGNMTVSFGDIQLLYSSAS